MAKIMPQITTSATSTTDVPTQKFAGVDAADASKIVVVTSDPTSGDTFDYADPSVIAGGRWQDGDAATDVVLETSTDKVGIGTTNPDSKLHVETAASHAAITIARNTQATGEVGINLDGGTGGKIWYVVQQAGSDNLTFWDSNGDAARVTYKSGGDVGIGTTSPDSALHVQTAASHCSVTLERDTKATGEVGINLNGGTGGKFWYLVQQSNSDNLTFHDTDAARVTFEHGGDVGIGVTDPDAKLEVLSTTTQLKASYDADSLATITVADDSHTTIATGESGNMILDAAGQLELNSDAGGVTFKDGSQKAMSIDMVTTAGDAIFRDAGDTEIFRIDGSQDSLLMASGKSIQFADDEESITSDGTDLSIVAGTDIVLRPGGLIDLYPESVTIAAGTDFGTGMHTIVNTTAKVTKRKIAGIEEWTTELQLVLDNARCGATAGDAIGLDESYGTLPTWFLNTAGGGAGHIGNAGVSHIVMICTETPDSPLVNITIAANPSNSIEQDDPVISGGAALVNATPYPTIAKGISASGPAPAMASLPSMQYLYLTCAPTSGGEQDFSKGQYRIIITSYNI